MIDKEDRRHLKLSSKLRFDYSNALAFAGQHELDYLAPYVKTAHEQLHNKTGAGNDYLGWIDLPTQYDKEEFQRIKEAAKRIQADSEVLVVIGIGGSYFGASAAIEMLSHSFYNLLPKEKRGTPQIFFAGHNISSVYIKHLIELIGDRDFSVNVISKSGTTTEPAIAFRIFKEPLENKYGKEGAEAHLCYDGQSERRAEERKRTEGYETFVIPDDVGGRYSVLTAVGLLPIAVADIDIDEMMQGAATHRKNMRTRTWRKMRAINMRQCAMRFIAKGR